MDMALSNNFLADTPGLKDLLFKEVHFNANSEVLDSFIKSLDATDDTKETYLKGARKFINWCEENNITEVTKEDLIAYKTYITQHNKPSSVSMYITSLKKLYKFLETKGIKNLASDLKGGKNSKGFKKDTLTVEQVKELLKSIDTSTLEGKRNYAMTYIFVTTGLRTIELERANIEDIRTIGSQSVLYVQGKGHQEKDEFVKLTYEVLKAINEYLLARGEKDIKQPLFISLSDRTKGSRLKTRSIRDIIKKEFRNIGIDSEKITTHSLRHTAITLSLIGGTPLQEVQQMARHSNINTTLIYAHNLNRIESQAEDNIQKLLSD